VFIGGLALAPQRERKTDIAANLRDRISRGDLAVGTVLNSADLAADFGTSRNTVMAALKMLSDEGMIVGQKARGYMVRDWAATRRIREDRAVRRDDRGYYFDKVSSRWWRIGKTAVEWEDADPQTAGFLGIEPGARVLARSRTIGVPDQPEQIAVSRIPADIAFELGLDGEITGQGGFLDRIEETYGALTFADVSMARNATTDEALRLGMAAGGPLLIVVTVASSATRPLALTEYLMDASRWAVAHQLERRAET
jgi:GntR family transcriptional regulator